MRDPISELTGEHISRGGLSNRVLRGDGVFRRPSAGEKSEAEFGSDKELPTKDVIQSRNCILRLRAR